ncbi:MAG: hypothetical protein WAZ19_13260 [Anaerolineae bacterium]
MFKQIRNRWLIAVTVVVLSMGLFVIRATQVRSDPGVPDSDEAMEIMATMDRAYQVIASASQTFDISELPSVFVNTSDYTLTARQMEKVAEIVGQAEASSAGYLTVMQAQYVAWGQGARLLQKALDKAKAEDREVTADELQEVVKANHGQMPALASPVITKTVLTYESMQITGDRAVVRYDDGAALQEAILVRVNGRWFVAGITPIWTHF